MKILPLKLITQEEQDVFGTSICNLAHLARNNLFVPEGIVIKTPCGQNFSSKKVSLPLELLKELDKKKSFLVGGKVVKSKDLVWQELVQKWADEWQKNIRSGDQLEKINLRPQVIFFVYPEVSKIKAHFDPEIKEVVINSEVKLLPKQLKQIDEAVSLANRLLFLPQVYEFLVDSQERVILIGLSPFTQTAYPPKDMVVEVIPKKEQNLFIKSAMKLFFNFSKSPGINSDLSGIDGVFIEAEKIATFDETVSKLVEAATGHPEKSVIFKLPDPPGNFGGSLGLTLRRKALDDAARTFLFVKNKKNLNNLELVIPFLRTTRELLEVKKELAVLGITRKGRLKIWAEVSTPAGLIEIDRYVNIGIDGVIIDVGRLQEFLMGFSLEEKEYYQKELTALLEFLKPVLKVLHRQRIPLLARGNLVLHPDILEFLIEEGVWGIVAGSYQEAQFLPEHLHFAEKRMVLKRLRN